MWRSWPITRSTNQNWLISHQQIFSREMSWSTPTQHDGRAVLFAVSEFPVCLCAAVRYWMTENMRVCLHICCCFRGTMWDLEHVHKTTWSGLYMLQCRRMTTPPGIKLSVTARLWRHRLALTESLIPGGDLVRGHCSMCRPAQVAYGTCPPRVTQQIACWMFRKAISNNSQ